MTLASVLAAKSLQAGVSGGGGGGNTISGGGLGFNFDSQVDAKATSITASGSGGPIWLRTQGFYLPGDEGGGLYVRQSTEPSWGGNAGYFRSLDGSYWVLAPEDGIVKPTQFGAIRGKEWNDASIDQFQYFDDCIWFIVNQGYRAHLTMFIPSSWYYFSKPLTFHAGQFNVRGSSTGRDGSVLWWPLGTHGIIVGYCEAGWVTIDAEGGPYHGNFAGQFVGDTRYGTGADEHHVYVCTVAGIPGGWNSLLGQWASPPTGTGLNQLDGTVRWDYQRELTRLEILALANGQAGGGRFEDLELYCGGDWRTPRAQNNHSGIVSRNRSVVINVFAASWPGCGVAMASDGDTTFRGGSNCDGWHVQHSSFYWNGLDGLHIGNSKSNAGIAIDIDTASNGRWGIANWCFLDNAFIAAQVAFDGFIGGGALPQYAHGVSYNGRYYIARIPIGGLESTVTTDTTSGYQSFAAYQSPVPASNSFWVYVGGDGSWGPSQDYPLWSSSGLYEPGGGYSGNNFNDRSVYIKPYVEGGTFTSQFMPFHVILGGLLQSAQGGVQLGDNKWVQSLNVVSASANTTTGVTKNIQYTFGSGGNNSYQINTYPKRILSVNEYEGTTFLLEGVATTFDATDWKFNSLATDGFNKYNIMTLCTLNTAQQWGTGVAQAMTVQIPSLVIGNGGTDGRIVRMGTAAPVSGTHAQGEIVWNQNAAVGQPKGWQCTVGGTSGTWVSMGNL